MLKKMIVLLVLLFSNYTFSQFHYFYFGGGKSEPERLKYHDKYYDANPRGLKQFVEETEMSDELKGDLKEQIKKISNKKITSKIFTYGGFGTGAGIMINEVMTTEDGETYNKTNLFKGLGVALAGAIIGYIISPKNKDYYEFVNTFNEKQNDKINFSLKVDYDRQMNYGFVMSF